MGNNGFFGNWAKYSMEKRMNPINELDWAWKNPDLYTKEDLVHLIKCASKALLSFGTEEMAFKRPESVKNDDIYDESGFQIGSAAPLEKNVERLDYYTCRATSLHNLEQQVNKLVKVGYKPQGGIAVMNHTMYQAVFLDLPKETVVAPTYDKKYMHF
jgi:hypothetical protein